MLEKLLGRERATIVASDFILIANDWIKESRISRSSYLPNSGSLSNDASLDHRLLLPLAVEVSLWRDVHSFEALGKSRHCTLFRALAVVWLYCLLLARTCILLLLHFSHSVFSVRQCRGPERARISLSIFTRESKVCSHVFSTTKKLNRDIIVRGTGKVLWYDHFCLNDIFTIQKSLFQPYRMSDSSP